MRVVLNNIVFAPWIILNIIKIDSCISNILLIHY